MSPNNYLDTSKRAFGTSGINTGNLIFEAAKSINPEAIIQYEESKKLVVVKNLGRLTVQDFGKVLYNYNKIGNTTKYNGWYPKVEEKKDPDGKLFN